MGQMLNIHEIFITPHDRIIEEIIEDMSNEVAKSVLRHHYIVYEFPEDITPETQKSILIQLGRYYIITNVDENIIIIYF